MVALWHPEGFLADFSISGFYCTKGLVFFHQLGGIIPLGWGNSAWTHLELLQQSSVDANSGLGGSLLQSSVFFLGYVLVFFFFFFLSFSFLLYIFPF